MVLTTKDIREMQDRLYNHCKAQAIKKGNDYSGSSEDTFMNLRLVKEFKVTQNDMQTVLAELVKKCSRLSNFSQPGFVSQVKDESAFDTISDLHNYATYWLMFFEETKQKENDKQLDPYILDVGKSTISLFQHIASLDKKKKKKSTPKRKTTVKPKHKDQTDEERIKQLFKPKRKGGKKK